MLTETQERAITLWRERKSTSEITQACAISRTSLRRLLRNLDRRGLLGRREPQAVDTAGATDMPGVSLLDLTHDACRFPITDLSTRDHRYCGVKRRVGSSYCGEHHALCYRPSERRRDRVRVGRDRHGLIRILEN